MHHESVQEFARLSTCWRVWDRDGPFNTGDKGKVLRVVGVDLCPGQNVLTDAIGQRRRQGACAANPISQGRALDLDALASVDRGLPV